MNNGSYREKHNETNPLKLSVDGYKLVGGSIMVWGMVSYHSLGALVIVGNNVH